MLPRRIQRLLLAAYVVILSRDKHLFACRLGSFDIYSMTPRKTAEGSGGRLAIPQPRAARVPAALTFSVVRRRISFKRAHLSMRSRENLSLANRHPAPHSYAYNREKKSDSHLHGLRSTTLKTSSPWEDISPNAVLDAEHVVAEPIACNLSAIHMDHLPLQTLIKYRRAASRVLIRHSRHYMIQFAGQTSIIMTTARRTANQHWRLPLAQQNHVYAMLSVTGRRSRTNAIARDGYATTGSYRPLSSSVSCGTQGTLSAALS